MAAGPDACRAQAHSGRLAEAKQCYAGLVSSSDPYVRAEALWGLGRTKEANEAFRFAVDRQPKNADYRVRWGRLLLEGFNPADAATLFQEALEINPNHAGAMLGLALVAAENFETRAVEQARKALAADPKLVEAQELLARLALEDGSAERAVKEADKALALSPEALDAMAVRATVEWLEGPWEAPEGSNAPPPESPWMARALKTNPVYGEGYSLAARIFMLNRRYEETIQLYRKAIELRPDLWEARSQLGINLMRVGRDAEARKHLEMCYENGYRNASTVNPLRLLDSYKNFVTYKTPRTVVKLDRKEAEVLRPYIEGELNRAMAVYDKKYRVTLKRPVQLEVFPNHDDFAVRTMGMPGLGALGVAFGHAVAMDSPSGRKSGEFHWASTLWHELSHVYVLAATKHRVPRWFTEGLAVYEETAISPEWGDRLDPEIILAIKDKKLLPVAQLDRGFVRPAYPAQVIVSYFQAGRICQYIERTWGWDKLLQMIQAFAGRKTTAEAIRQTLGIAPEDLDKRFLAWLDTQTGKTVASFDDWRERIKKLAAAAKAGRHEDVIRDGPAVRDLYPDYVETGSAYEFVANAHLALGDKPAAIAELERYARTGGRDPELIKQLAALLEEAGRKKEAAAALERLIYVDPLDQEVHTRLGRLWLEQGNAKGAIREYGAVLALKPGDAAAAHYNMAMAYRGAKMLENAKEHVFLALEAAPGYRPAQKLLLELGAP